CPGRAHPAKPAHPPLGGRQPDAGRTFAGAGARGPALPAGAGGGGSVVPADSSAAILRDEAAPPFLLQPVLYSRTLTGPSRPRSGGPHAHLACRSLRLPDHAPRTSSGPVPGGHVRQAAPLPGTAATRGAAGPRPADRSVDHENGNPSNLQEQGALYGDGTV